MLERLALKFADLLVAKGADPEEKEVYAFAIEYLLSNIISYAILLILAAFLNRIPEMLLFFLFWIPLRTNMGGLHAPTQTLCFILSAIFGVGAVLIAVYLIPNFLVILISLAICIFVTFMIAPVIHPNHPVTEKRRLEGKKAARIIVIAESAAVVICYALFPLWIASIGMYSVVFAVLFGALGKLTNKPAQTLE